MLAVRTMIRKAIEPTGNIEFGILYAPPDRLTGCPGATQGRVISPIPKPQAGIDAAAQPQL